MDILQAIATSVAVMVIVLLMALFVCHYFGPRATAWIRSNREEKIGLSKNRLYNANGYLIQSSTEFLVGSSGSFKRFDSVDRDCKELQGQQTVPLWNIPINDIPPQPLRPAPSSPSAIVSPKAQITHQQRPPTKTEARPIKQQSLEPKTVSPSMVIPRPVTRRQLSTPVSSSPFSPLLNVPGSMHKTNCAKKSMSTNPFLNGSLDSAADNQTVRREVASINPFEETTKVSGDLILAEETNRVDKETHLSEIFTFDTTKINELLLMEEENTTVKNALLEAEGSIKKLESVTLDDRKHRQDYEEFLRLQNELNWNKVRESSKKKNPPIRNRSLSETEASSGKKLTQPSTDHPVQSTNPFVVADSSSVLHKTASENYLQQYSGQVIGIRSTRAMQNAWGLSKEKTKKTFTGSQSSISESEVSTMMSNENLYRAVSCESVSSQSSVVLADLEEPAVPSVTGYLCIGLHYDKNTISDEGVELIVTVLEAKELVGPPDAKFMDTFVRIYLVPDETGASQTKLFKDSACPSYNETFSFFMSNKHTRRSLWFHLYHSGMAHTLIGEAEMQLSDLSARPITTWLALSDSRHNKSCNWGELMICLSYLPTAERLTVVVVKARNLRIDQKMQELENVFVKVYLLKDDRKVSKKKTSTKRKEKSPIYNESIIFSVPPYMLSSIQVRLTVAHQLENDTSCVVSLGHVILGSAASGKGLRHWNQMISSVRKPVAMWHPLRRPALPRHQLQTTKSHS